MAESHIETRTPEEMLQQAYDRCIRLGNAVIELYGYKHEYTYGALYKFLFDPKGIYVYVGWKERDAYPDKKMIIFSRVSDNKKLTMTKYSEPAEKIN